MSSLVVWARMKSPWLFHFNSGSCNNCDIELVDVLTPRFDVERFGILLEGSPRHADVLVVTGAVNRQTLPRLKRIYDQMPNPKVVVALGTCATSGGIFTDSYNFAGPLDKVIPVDVYIPGCPPRPQAMIDGIVKALAKIQALRGGVR